MAHQKPVSEFMKPGTMKVCCLLMGLFMLLAGSPLRAWDNVQTHVEFNRLAWEYFAEFFSKMPKNPYKYYDMGVVYDMVGQEHALKSAGVLAGDVKTKEITDPDFSLNYIRKPTLDIGLAWWKSFLTLEDTFTRWDPDANWKEVNAPIINPFEGFKGLKIIHSKEDVSFYNLKWIVLTGGEYADYPVVDQALRHFYDPLAITGKASLTDTFGYPAVEMDMFTWTFSAGDNAYNLQKAKEYMQAAFQTTDETIRKDNFGLAYRALGQALHLFNDLACPPHVRNDGHPYKDTSESVPTGENLKNVVKPFAQNIRLTDLRMPQGFAGNVQTPGQPFLLCHVGLKDLFRSIAKWVNPRFFSDETICDDKTGLIPEPFHHYPRPQLSDLNENQKGKRFEEQFSQIGGRSVVVPMVEKTLVEVVERTYGQTVFEGSKGAYTEKTKMVPRYTIPADFVLQQLDILVPICIRTGAELIERFIPTLRIELGIQHLADDQDVARDIPDRSKILHTYRITGKLVHDTTGDDFWSDSPLKYSGPGTLYIEGNMGGKKTVLPVKVEFKDGDLVMEKTSDSKGLPVFKEGLGGLPENFIAVCFVGVGGLVVRSPLTKGVATRINPFEVKEGLTQTRYQWSFSPSCDFPRPGVSQQEFLPPTVRTFPPWDLLTEWSIQGPETVSGFRVNGSEFFHYFSKKGEYEITCRVLDKDHPEICLGEARAFASIVKDPEPVKPTTDYATGKVSQLPQNNLPNETTGGVTWENSGPDVEEMIEWKAKEDRRVKEKNPPEEIRLRLEYIQALKDRYRPD